VSGPEGLVAEWGTILHAAGYHVVIFDPERRIDKGRLGFEAQVVRQPDASAVVAIELELVDTQAKRARLTACDDAFPPDTVILTNCLTVSVAEQSSWIRGSHRLLGIGALPTFVSHPLVELAPSGRTPTQTVEAAREFFRSLGKQVEVVQDRAGLVAARVICQIINEAAFALQDDVATPQDIDTSMKLGVSYPHGPFEWADRLGIQNVVAVLNALHEEYQEERYRLSPLLRSMAWSGPWWTSNGTNTTR
jgi:3-hydroxybutyryl-CoA dehydrogenase